MRLAKLLFTIKWQPNTLNEYFISVFTPERLDNIPVATQMFEAGKENDLGGYTHNVRNIQEHWQVKESKAQVSMEFNPKSQMN